MRMPALETERLVVRQFTPEDLADLHRILDGESAPTAPGASALSLGERESWLRRTTTRDNRASIGVMLRAGMLVDENPHAGRLEVVGVKSN